MLRVAGRTSLIKEGLDSILKEVRLFAAIKSSRVVSYMHSWLEIAYTEGPRKEPAEACAANCEPDVQLLSPDIEFCSGPELPSDDEPEPQPQKSHVERITLYIQMELCKTTLYEHLNSEVEYDYEKSLSLAYQIVKALNVIHDCGLIHRDITPKNIFFARDGKVKIGDFGLATTCKNLILDLPSPLISPAEAADEVKELSIGESAESTEDTKESSEKPMLTNGIGTKEFVSPEQLSKSYYDQSTDIYSLGLVFLYLFCPTETQSERYSQLRDCRDGKLPSHLVEHYPQLTSLIQSMISVIPSHRPKTRDILSHSLFGRFNWDAETKTSRSAESVSLGQAQRAIVMIGEDWKLREMLIRVAGGKLLGYKDLKSKKARFSYPLAECSVRFAQTSASTSRKEPAAKNGVEILEYLTAAEEGSSIASRDDILEIKHPELETLHLMTNARHDLLIEEFDS